MKCFFSLAAVFSLVLADPGFVQLPLSAEKVNTTNSQSVAAHARAYIPDKLQNGVAQYFVNIDLGTPGQTQKVSIDTGSSDLWVYSKQSNGAQYTYDPSQSSTSKYVDDGFSITYVDGSGASGDYYTDESELGGTKVNFQFGVNDQDSTGTNGVFGIAASGLESDTYGTYANYPMALKQQGIIESTAYSLYLNDVDASSGSLLFGGVDTSKYSGTLYTVPITSSSRFSVDFEVKGHKLNGVLDSGTALTYLPDDIVSSLAQQFGAQWDDDARNKGYYVDQVPENASLTYSFSGAEVTVSASELFLDTGDNYLFTILPYSYSQQTVLLGDTTLRSAYVVYDLDNNQIGIAQANYGGSGSIHPITSDGIPGSQQAPGF